MTMKLATLLSVSMLATSSAFAAATAESSNVFGVLRVDSDSARTIVAVPWVAAGVEAGDIKVTDLVKTSNLTPADENYTGDTLSYYDHSDSKKFKSWRLVPGESGAAPHWEAATSVVANGDPQPGTDESVQGLPRGGALILVRKEPANSIFLQGQYSSAPMSAQTLASGGTKMSPVYSLIAPPSTKGDDFDLMSGKWSNVGNDDQIIIQQAGGKNIVCQWDGSAWKVGEWQGNGPFKTFSLTGNAPLIPAGTGCWYVSRTSGENAPTVQW